MVDADAVFTILLELLTAWLEDLGNLADKVGIESSPTTMINGCRTRCTDHFLDSSVTIPVRLKFKVSGN